MNNDVQNFISESERDRERNNFYIEVSLFAFFLSVIIFSALVLLG